MLGALFVWSPFLLVAHFCLDACLFRWTRFFFVGRAFLVGRALFVGHAFFVDAFSVVDARFCFGRAFLFDARCF